MSRHCKGQAPIVGLKGVCAETANWCTESGTFTSHFINVDWDSGPLHKAQPHPAGPEERHLQAWARRHSDTLLGIGKLGSFRTAVAARPDGDEAAKGDGAEVSEPVEMERETIRRRAEECGCGMCYWCEGGRL